LLRGQLIVLDGLIYMMKRERGGEGMMKGYRGCHHHPIDQRMSSSPKRFSTQTPLLKYAARWYCESPCPYRITAACDH